MKLDKIANSGNDEFYTPKYAINPLVKYLDPSKSIWCPFDTDQSLIYKTLSNSGYSVIQTHISTGSDFFTTDPLGDVIVSNPPYSIKGKVFSRLFELGKPFAMLVGVVGLFESKERFELFKANEFEIMWLSKRIAYFKSYDEQKPSLNPPFSSVWITHKILPSQNVFEYVNK